MSKLERLIQQYCPDGVEYVRLVDYANVLYGCPFDATQFTDDNSFIPLIRIRDILSGKAGTYYKGDYSQDYIVKKGDILVGMDGNFNLGIWNDIDGLLCQRVCKLYAKDETRLLNGFIRHYMKPVFRQIEESTPGGSVKHLSAKAIKSIRIPLPPLPVQKEIVRILDAFTELQAELQAELQKRQQQYNFYRDNLLTNFTEEQNVKEYSLGELGTFTRGNGLQKKDFTKEGVGCIHYGQIYTRFGAFADKTLTYVNKELASRLLQVEKGNLVIACTSENVEDICKSVAWLGEENICTGGHACVFKHNQNPKYISYFFQTEYFFNQKKKYTYGTKVKDIKPDSIAKIKISLPSLKEQERIVSILDNLYTLTNDLTSGLPAEMEKRRQQYEYYRDRLLTFKRL